MRATYTAWAPDLCACAVAGTQSGAPEASSCSSFCALWSVAVLDPAAEMDELLRLRYTMLCIPYRRVRHMFSCNSRSTVAFLRRPKSETPQFGHNACEHRKTATKLFNAHHICE